MQIESYKLIGDMYRYICEILRLTRISSELIVPNEYFEVTVQKDLDNETPIESAQKYYEKALKLVDKFIEE